MKEEKERESDREGSDILQTKNLSIRKNYKRRANIFRTHIAIYAMCSNDPHGEKHLHISHSLWVMACRRIIFLVTSETNFQFYFIIFSWLGLFFVNCKQAFTQVTYRPRSAQTPRRPNILYNIAHNTIYEIINSNGAITNWRYRICSRWISLPRSFSLSLTCTRSSQREDIINYIYVSKQSIV